MQKDKEAPLCPVTERWERGLKDESASAGEKPHECSASPSGWPALRVYQAMRWLPGGWQGESRWIDGGTH